MSIDVGERLRNVRVTFGLSQRALARRAGVTNGLISLIEQNRVSPSVSSLKKVLDGVPMSLAEFFTLDLAAAPQAFFTAEELTEIGNEQVSLRMVASTRGGRRFLPGLLGRPRIGRRDLPVAPGSAERALVFGRVL